MKMTPKDWSIGNQALARILKRSDSLGVAYTLFAVEVFQGVKPTDLMLEVLQYYFEGQVPHIQSEMAEERAA